VNVDENPRTAMEYRITSIPTVKVFRSGQIVGSVIGARPKASFERELAEYLL
jgi:thioredoxin 1